MLKRAALFAIGGSAMWYLSSLIIVIIPKNNIIFLSDLSSLFIVENRIVILQPTVKSDEFDKWDWVKP